MKPLRSLAVSLCLICCLVFGSCAKQTPDMLPGAAAIATIKTSLTVAGLVIATTRAALPAFKLDAEDQTNADGVLNDIETARAIFADKIAPYTTFDASNSAQIKQAAQDAVATLTALHGARIDHIKNPKAREQVDGALKALETVLDLVIQLKQPA